MCPGSESFHPVESFPIEVMVGKAPIDRQIDCAKVSEVDLASSEISKSDLFFLTEGVEVSVSGAPIKYRVNLARYGWCENMLANTPTVNLLTLSFQFPSMYT